MSALAWKRGQYPVLGGHFGAREFECGCDRCIDQQVDTELVARLNALRDEFGAPIIITSGYRCHAHQLQLAQMGFQTANGISQHELGRAADIRAGGSVAGNRASDHKRLVELAEKHFKAVGVAPEWLHVDLRDDKVRRWTYTK